MKTKYLAGALLLSLGFAAASCSDDDYSYATGDIVSSISTGDAVVTATTAVTEGNVLGLSSYSSSSYEVGVYYSTTSDPAAGKKQTGSYDTASGAVSATISGLTKGQTYYYATYVTLQGKVTKFGETKNFTTTDARIATADAASITSTTAVIGGVADASADQINAGSTTVEYGLRLSDSQDGVVENTGDDYVVTSADKSFSVTAKGLLPAHTYYYASYFKMGSSVVLGDVKSFTTQSKAMEYVDLGLSVLWAKYNIGAESETEAGRLFGYGDVTGLLTSDYNGYYANADISQTENDVVNAIHTAIDGEATMTSFLPTQALYEELINGTTQEWTEVDGVSGVRFTGKNGNSVFFPAAGYRSEQTVSEEGEQGLYWTGNVSTINGDYAKTLCFGSNGATIGNSERHLGLAIRSVRQPEPVFELAVDNSKIIYGDIENNGRLRIEIFNLYGAGTAANPPINVQQLKFSKNMIVTFTLSGIEAEGVDCYGGLEYADESWDPSLWSAFNSKYDCHVTGNGTYTVWMETGGVTAEGANVFTIDIDGLHTALGDGINNVKAEINSIKFDVEDSQMQYYVDNSKVLFNSKDGEGIDGRIEIYNEYGDTKGAGVDVSDLSFSGYQIITYTITGIDGNLIEGASKNYPTELSYATPSWWPSWWGNETHDAVGSSVVTGDGTYTVFAPLDGNACAGAVVWCVEIYGLWKELVDPSLVKVNIDSVVIPGKK